MTVLNGHVVVSCKHCILNYFCSLWHLGKLSSLLACIYNKNDSAFFSEKIMATQANRPTQANTLAQAYTLMWMCV